MIKRYQDKALLFILIAGIPASTQAAAYMRQNIVGLSLGVSGAAVTGIACWLIASKNSAAKYAYKTLKAQQNAEERRECEIRAHEQAVSMALAHAEDFLKPFKTMLDSCNRVELEDLIQNADFQQTLINLVIGSNCSPERVTEFNRETFEIAQALRSVTEAEYAHTVEQYRNDLMRLKQLVNNSSRLHEIEKNLKIEQCEIAEAQAKAREREARAAREQQITHSVKAQCAINDQEARERLHATEKVNQLADGIPARLNRIEANVEATMHQVHQTIHQRIADQNQILAQSMNILSQVAASAPHLEHAMHAAQQVIHQNNMQLNRIEGKLDQNYELAQQFLAAMPADLRVSLEKYIAQQLYTLEQRIRQEIRVVQQNTQQDQVPHCSEASAPFMPLDPAQESV